MSSRWLNSLLPPPNPTQPTKYVNAILCELFLVRNCSDLRSTGDIWGRVRMLQPLIHTSNQYGTDYFLFTHFVLQIADICFSYGALFWLVLSYPYAIKSSIQQNHYSFQCLFSLFFLYLNMSFSPAFILWLS